MNTIIDDYCQEVLESEPSSLLQLNHSSGVWEISAAFTDEGTYTPLGDLVYADNKHDDTILDEKAIQEIIKESTLYFQNENAERITNLLSNPMTTHVAIGIALSENGRMRILQVYLNDSPLRYITKLAFHPRDESYETIVPENIVFEFPILVLRSSDVANQEEVLSDIRLVHLKECPKGFTNTHDLAFLDEDGKTIQVTLAFKVRKQIIRSGKNSMRSD